VSKLLSVASLFALFASLAFAQPAALKSLANGVIISVQPTDLSAGAASWDFAVSMDTHSQELSDDLVKSTVLLDATGREHRPIAWDGAGPGGHHRAGTLKFAPIVPSPSWVELRILRQGETEPRTFRWPPH
jgi:hypothetical protein